MVSEWDDTELTLDWVVIVNYGPNVDKNCWTLIALC